MDIKEYLELQKQGKITPKNVFTTKDFVSEFFYNHKELFPKRAYNQFHKVYTKDMTVDKVLTYKMLKKCNSETFEYGGVSTEVKVTPLYHAYQYKIKEPLKFTRIYISTSDDSCMNLWLDLQPKHIINKILKFYENKRVLESCRKEYEILEQEFNWSKVYTGYQ